MTDKTERSFQITKVRDYPCGCCLRNMVKWPRKPGDPIPRCRDDGSGSSACTYCQQNQKPCFTPVGALKIHGRVLKQILDSCEGLPTKKVKTAQAAMSKALQGVKGTEEYKKQELERGEILEQRRRNVLALEALALCGKELVEEVRVIQRHLKNIASLFNLNGCVIADRVRQASAFTSLQQHDQDVAINNPRIDFTLEQQIQECLERAL